MATIKTTFDLGNEVFIVEEGVIYKAYIEGVSVVKNSKEEEVFYDVKIERNYGIDGLDFEELEDIQAEDLFSSLKEAQKEKENQAREREEEERREQIYREEKEKRENLFVTTKTFCDTWEISLRNL